MVITYSKIRRQLLWNLSIKPYHVAKNFKCENTLNSQPIFKLEINIPHAHL